MKTLECPISASAPGSLMLLGEHAVLHGRRALVCAINKRITVCVSKCPEAVVRIVSDLGNYEAPLGDLTDHPDFRFVLDVVKQYPLEQGISLKIESEFLSDIGFGSSAAVTVATHAALMKWVGTAVPAVRGPLGERSLPFDELFKRSLATIHRVQGRGSGADVAASVFGGVVAYRAEPLEIQHVENGTANVEQASRLIKRAGRSFYFPLTAVYSGAKMKTADVIRLVEERRALNADYFERIFDRMDASVGEVIESDKVERDLRARFACPPQEETRPAVAFHQNQKAFLECLGRNLILNQKLMEEMGLCNAALAEIIEEFQTLEVPAKISGSGLGDCAIGLGSFPAIGKFRTYNLQVDQGGVSVDS